MRSGLCSLLVGVFVLVLVATGSTPPAASAASCGPEIEFIAARGSSESPQPGNKPDDYSAANNYGMGNLLYGVYDKFAGLVGRDRVTPYGVHYPAVSVFGGASTVDGAGALLHIGVLGKYSDSVRDGTADVIARIESEHSKCADTRFVLAGYSQGAQAVADALQRMSDADRSLVKGAAFFGDPYFNADSWASMSSQGPHYGSLGVRDEYPESLHGAIFSYCQTKDPICALSDKHHILGDGDIYTRNYGYAHDTAPHRKYPTSDGPDAAQRLARLFGTTTTPTGNVPLDLVFAIDTTGSMGGVIGQVRDNVQALARSIASTSSNYRFALVDYKDGPDQGDPYKAQVDLPFSTDVDAFSNAASTLQASGGGDYPESMYSGIMTGLDLPWRNGVRKVVIVIGDAPGKDPEPGTGFTLAQVRDKALSVDPAQVYGVSVSSDSSVSAFMQQVADATGGQVTDAPDQSTFVNKLQAAIVQAGSAPVADVGTSYDAVTGDPVTLTAGGSRSESENLTGYDWDYNGDGTYDETTSDPVVRHTYTAAGDYNLVVRVRSESGLAATATATVHVTDPPAAGPGTPQSLTATAGDGQVTLSWHEASTGPAAEWFTITDNDGTVIDTVATGTSGTAPPGWIRQDLTNGQNYGFKVRAGNVAGNSDYAGPVSTTPHAPNSLPVVTADAFSTDNATPLTVPAPGVLANDTDSDTGQTLSAHLVSGTGHGTVTLAADGSFTYSANRGYVGSDSFTYTVSDGTDTSMPATVTIEVTSPAATGQRLILLADGRPPVIVVGRASSGGFTIAKRAGAISSVSGTGRFGSASVTLNITRTGTTWTGTAKVVRSSSTRTLTGRGRLDQAGRVLVGRFQGAGVHWGFAILSPTGHH